MIARKSNTSDILEGHRFPCLEQLYLSGYGFRLFQGNFPYLKVIQLDGCYDFIGQLPDMPVLEELWIDVFPYRIINLFAHRPPSSLRFLFMRHASSHFIPQIAQCTSLKKLCLVQCPETRLDGLSSLKELEIMYIVKSKLKEIHLEGLDSLRKITLAQTIFNTDKEALQQLKLQFLSKSKVNVVLHTGGYELYCVIAREIYENIACN